MGLKQSAVVLFLFLTYKLIDYKSKLVVVVCFYLFIHTGAQAGEAGPVVSCWLKA